MDLAKLDKFVAVAKCGHFGRAADALGMSQQALSKGIAALERELQVKLFERGAFGATLTPYGELLLRRARLVDAELRLGLAEINAMRGSMEGQVRIGVGLSMVGRVMPRALLRMHEAYPHVALSACVETSAALFPMLLHGDLDFVVSAPPEQFVVDPELRQEQLFLDRDVLCVRAAHPLASAPGISLADLQPHLWLSSAQLGTTWQRVCREFTAQGLEPPARVLCLDSTALGKELLLQSDCLAMLSRENVDAELRSGILRELQVPRLGETRVAALTTRARSPLQPAASRAIQFVRAVCAELHGTPP